MSVPYRDIGGPNGYLANREPFIGNSMSAAYSRTTGDYVVYSYGTEIARVTPDGHVRHNRTYYSRTTSRHQGLCRAWLYSIEDHIQVIEVAL